MLLYINWEKNILFVLIFADMLIKMCHFEGPLTKLKENKSKKKVIQIVILCEL